MVFKFLRELIDSAKEGVAEAKAELAEEAAHRRIEEEGTRDQLIERLGTASPFEILTLQLGAPYRGIFIDNDLESLASFDVADDKKAELAKLLNRDFAVVDGPSALRAYWIMEIMAYGDALARAISAQLNEGIDTGRQERDLSRIGEAITAASDAGDGKPGAPDSGQLAALAGELRQEFVEQVLPQEPGWQPHFAHMAAKVTYLATASAGLGHLTKAEALELSAPLVRLCHQIFAGWEEFASAFTSGLKEDPTANFLSRKLLSGRASSLLTSEDSPWVVFGWPDRLE